MRYGHVLIINFIFSNFCLFRFYGFSVYVFCVAIVSCLIFVCVIFCPVIRRNKDECIHAYVSCMLLAWHMMIAPQTQMPPQRHCAYVPYKAVSPNPRPRKTLWKTR